MPLGRPAAFLLVALLAAAIADVTALQPVYAISLSVDVDTPEPGDMLGFIQKNAKKKTPAPAKKTATPTAKPAVTSPKAGLPPKGEVRFATNEILVETTETISAADLAAIARRNRLTLEETADITLLKADVHRFLITDKRDVRTVIAAVAAEPLVEFVQPNYSYGLLDAATASGPPQYAADLLHLSDAHALATGKAVRVGILDTAVATDDTELGGSIAQSFDAIGVTDGDDPSHGTALAGIVAAHGQLIGVAPGAMLFSARVFVAANGKPPGSTSMLLLKGLDWLASNKAQIVNMSFAGPADPLFLKELKAAHDGGILAVAAAGNDGPKAAPDYPAADPSALGVTAVDDGDAVLPQANQGSYVAVAAPGVDVLVLAPDGSLSTSSGTSMAAAHVTGAAALLLERDPTLTPDKLTALLTGTADDLGARGRDSVFGAGLIDPVKALGTLPPPVATAASASSAELPSVQPPPAPSSADTSSSSAASEASSSAP